MLFSLIPTASRFTQPSDYMNVNGSFVPFLTHPGDQEANSKVTVSIYMFFCVSSLLCNIIACIVHRKQKRMQFFETQPKLASTVQTNLLIYACLSTTIVVFMTVFQLTLALHIFDVQSEAHRKVLVCFTLAADAFALSNPWLLFGLSKTFRQKFLAKRHLKRIFVEPPSTNETS
uniref:Serpentine receptor class gamma n=1 Tax=Caenorhabditis japonica TaxID=281687 RepID=A0A8R1HK52_CAEJA